jgi:hypothetical protein
MIRFRADGARGSFLGMGLSFDNLDRLQAGEPAFVPLEGSRGRIVLACSANHQALALLMVQFSGDHLVGLSPRMIDDLSGGQTVEIALEQIGVRGVNTGVLFAGPTEFEMVDALRAAGFVDAATRLTGLDEYLQHERNEVETCPLCRERRHRQRKAARATWQQTLVAHPNLAIVGLFGLFALIGLVVAWLR